MSSGKLTQSGSTVRYELQIPMFEVQHVTRPDVALPHAIQLEGAQRNAATCRQERENYMCQMDWEYPAPPASIVVQCRLVQVTVANHVHVLHAQRGEEVDQAIFQGSIERAELVFRKDGPLLAALRSRPSMLLIVLFTTLAMFALRSGWLGVRTSCIAYSAAAMKALLLTPEFLEATVALLAAYAAFEAAFLPPSKYRWMIAALLGATMGCYSAVLIPDLQIRQITGLSILLCVGPAAVWWTWGVRKLSFGLLAAALLWVVVLLS